MNIEVAIPKCKFSRNQKPKSTMSAADFKLKPMVCIQLQRLSTINEQTAEHNEKAIDVTEKTIESCKMTEQRIDRFFRINKKMLNNTFDKIEEALDEGPT